MINKYTVRFIDQQFENKYQSYMFKEQVFPLICSITAGIVLISFIEIIEGLMQADTEFSIIRVITIVTSISGTLVVRKWPKFAKFSNFLAVNYSIVYQYSLDSSVDSQYGYLMGSNLMLINLSFLVVSDFIDGSFNNILMFVSRVAITLLRSDTPYTQGHQYASFLFIVVILGLYNSIQVIKTVNGVTMLYILEQMLPKLIPSPFILFNYNEEQVKFELNLSNIRGHADGVIREVLRNYKLGKNTLEQFIHQRIKNHQTQEQTHQLLLSYNNQPITIQYSEFNIVGQKFLVVLPSDQLKLLEEKLYQISKFYIHQTTTFMNKVQSVLFTSIRNKKWNNIVYLYRKVGIKQNRMLCQYGERFEVQEFQLSEVVNNLNIFHKDKFQQDSSQQNLMKSLKPFMELVLSLIAKASIEQSIIRVHYLAPILRITGWIDVTKLDHNALFIKACGILFIQSIKTQDGFIFELSDNPNIRFTLHNLFLKQ